MKEFFIFLIKIFKSNLRPVTMKPDLGTLKIEKTMIDYGERQIQIRVQRKGKLKQK